MNFRSFRLRKCGSFETLNTGGPIMNRHLLKNSVWRLKSIKQYAQNHTSKGTKCCKTLTNVGEYAGILYTKLGDYTFV